MAHGIDHEDLKQRTLSKSLTCGKTFRWGVSQEEAVLHR
jgi:hypothetical protein